MFPINIIGSIFKNFRKIKGKILDEIVIVLAVLFLGSLVRAVFGFADALIAMPLLAVAIGLRSAAPLVAMMSAVNATVILVINRRHFQIKSAWKLILSTFLGIPVGLFMLKGLHEPIMRLILSAILIGFSLFNIIHPHMRGLSTDRLAPLFGWIAGILGGAYNTNGPPVVMYATLRNWTAERFRAVLNGYFLITGFMILAAHASAGLWTKFVISRFLMALPILALAHFLGHLISGKLSNKSFKTMIYWLLFIIGIYLAVQTISAI